MKVFHLLQISLLAVFLILACSDRTESASEQKDISLSNTKVQPKITFVELGSVNCIPCRKMQPIMKSIEEKYGGQVKVVFYDVWKPDQRHYAQIYGIRLIPTQIFLDEDENEIMRHEGFFPEEEIDAFLRAQGLSIITRS
jgi:thioredoxin 1